ncbi:MAG: response regulator transcription factor [Deltaproteobacteria bacterium]|nr:response regulator transcription factor [Deltaproteobacteria bacterium]
MARLLLIDDDRALLDVLSLAFEDAGYEVEVAVDGLAGWTAIHARSFALVVSDVNMPGLDGFALTRRLRESGSRLPIILLTSRDNEIDEALGLELGADDYVSKPFSTRVLVARCAALLRRESLRASGDAGAEGGVTVAGALRLDPDRLEARWRGEALVLTVSEFRLLECLARRPGIVHTRDHLLDVLRGEGSAVMDRIIDTYVRRLRRKLEAIDPSFDRIETVIGAGYRWVDDVT